MSPRRPSNAKIYRVQAVDRALDIMECFSFENRRLSLTEIARKTGLKKTTVKRLASSLVSRDFLGFDSETGRYWLGMRLFVLGGVVFSSFSLREAASRHMTALQQDTSATTLLGVLMDDQLIYIDKRDGTGSVRIASDIGWRRPPHFGMLGMVLMASLSEEQAGALLDRFPLTAVTPASITDRKAFRKRLVKTARNGYVAEYGEAVEGVIGVAAPIMDYTRKVAGAIGVAILEAQHGPDSVSRVIDRVRSAAEAISADLGYMEGECQPKRGGRRSP
jgi:IclR family KDG regulon transcriptional repressor